MIKEPVKVRRKQVQLVVSPFFFACYVARITANVYARLLGIFCGNSWDTPALLLRFICIKCRKYSTLGGTQIRGCKAHGVDVAISENGGKHNCRRPLQNEGLSVYSFFMFFFQASTAVPLTST